MCMMMYCSGGISWGGGGGGGRVMVFNATLNNISAILWQSVLLEETGLPRENYRYILVTP